MLKQIGGNVNRQVTQMVYRCFGGGFVVVVVFATLHEKKKSVSLQIGT